MGACGTGVATNPTDSITVISHGTTRDISVWTPEGDGPWPVVYALHGLGGHHTDLGELAAHLTNQGLLVFSAQHSAPDWAATQQDVECGYRYVRSVAEQYGGDLDQPVAFVGFSVGATLVLEHGLNQGTYGPGGRFGACFEGILRPEVIVPISGCHYAYAGNTLGFETDGWENSEAHLAVSAGGQDTVYEAWQSRDATDVLETAGYQVDLTTIADANHFTVIFHDVIDDQRVTVSDAPAGRRVVEVIVEAIGAATP